jgi:Uma2 family endonuclease
MSMGIKTALTPDDLLLLPEPENGKHYELSEGELIVVGHVGWRHESIKSTILTLLIVYLQTHRIGRAFSESQFTMAGGGARIPDVAFVSHGKLAPLPDEDIAIPFAPDLAIEIISNSEIAARAEKKVREYLASGVQEVWQVYPADRFVRVRTAEGIRDLAEDQLLETQVLPGFQVKVQAFFAR